MKFKTNIMIMNMIRSLQTFPIPLLPVKEENNESPNSLEQNPIDSLEDQVPHHFQVQTLFLKIHERPSPSNFSWRSPHPLRRGIHECVWS